MPAQSTDVVPVRVAELPSWEAPWRALEARSPGAAPFLCFDWLAAWAAVYSPGALAVAHVGSAEAPIALGLLELGSLGRWRFAGAPIASERSLLHAPADARAAWDGLDRWLATHPRAWRSVDAQGVGAGAGIAEARRSPSEVPVLTLPDSFDAYLQARSKGTRTRYRRILRRIERDGAELRPVPAADTGAALADLVELHRRRAASKGERHPAVDERLVKVLAALRGARSAELRLIELVQDGRRLGVTARIDRGGASWFYNAGFDPAAAALAPGIALELASIRETVELGSRRHDLGPGAFPYKLELGGVVERRFDVHATGGGVSGRLLQAAVGTSRQARDRWPIRTLARRAVRRLGGR